jgi:murein DD-endopeptidase MepM/ murein hydrolase activator NlpD
MVQNKGSKGSLLRITVNLIMVVVLVIAGVLLWQRIASARAGEAQAIPSPEVDNPGAEPEPQDEISVALPELVPSSLVSSIARQLELVTTIPERERIEVITYTVKKGDNLFAIADQYGLKPETILWGNFETLEDNPNLLKEGQVLNILPLNGTYYKWQNGDSLGGVASFFKVEQAAITEFMGNRFDLAALETGDTGLEAGDWIVVPGGKRPIKDWGPPAITRSNPASARYYGDGYCGEVYSGAVGSGTFVLPTVTKSISGYTYSDIHPGVDFAGAEGNAVFAVDSGVVVFSGWSNYGYGYMVVIDHGTGFQSAYAHLSAVAVTCGQSVFQGGYIGAVGNTGNSSGAHLHFELILNGAKPNPLGYLP